MNTGYILTEIIESKDNLTGLDIVIFELTPVEKSNSGTGYTFFPSALSSHYFIYEHSHTLIQAFLAEKDKLNTMDLKLFKPTLIQSPEGIRKTFFSNELANKRQVKIRPWYSGALDLIQHGKRVGFKFSHVESSVLKRNNFNQLVASNESNLRKETNYITIDKKNVLFSFENNRGIVVRLNGKIITMENSNTGHNLKIKTVTDWESSETYIDFTFDQRPNFPLNKSEKNLVVSILENKNESSYKFQWALHFGNYMGEVKLIL